MRLVYLGVFAIGLFAAGLGRIILSNGWRTFHYGVIWCAVFFTLLGIYDNRDDVHRMVAMVRGDALPSVALSNSGAEEELMRAWDGHYRADAVVNGTEIRMMVDTGASMVVLPYEQVARIGIDPTALDFSMPVMTANGRSTVAPIKLGEVRIGNIVVRDVPAAVAHPGRLQTGLLGMTFLDQLSETSFQGSRLFLRQGMIGTPARFAEVPLSR